MEKALIIDYKDIYLKAKVGSGADGTVYVALWRFKEVAIKRSIFDELDADTIKKFLNEVDVLWLVTL